MKIASSNRFGGPSIFRKYSFLIVLENFLKSVYIGVRFNEAEPEIWFLIGIFLRNILFNI